MMHQLNAMEKSSKDIEELRLTELHEQYTMVAEIITKLVVNINKLDSDNVIRYLQNIQLNCIRIRSEYLNNELMYKDYRKPLLNILLYRANDLLEKIDLHINALMLGSVYSINEETLGIVYKIAGELYIISEKFDKLN